MVFSLVGLCDMVVSILRFSGEGSPSRPFPLREALAWCLSIIGFYGNVRLSDKDLRSVQLFILICSIVELSGRMF